MQYHGNPIISTYKLGTLSWRLLSCTDSSIIVQFNSKISNCSTLVRKVGSSSMNFVEKAPSLHLNV